MADAAMLAARGPRLTDDAVRMFVAAAGLAPDDPAPLMAEARLCRQSGDMRRARELFRAAFRRDGALWQALAEGAECFGWFAYLRRTVWLGRAMRAATDAGLATPGELRDRFLTNYSRLRPWERWLVRMRFQRPGGQTT